MVNRAFLILLLLVVVTVALSTQLAVGENGLSQGHNVIAGTQGQAAAAASDSRPGQPPPSPDLSQYDPTVLRKIEPALLKAALQPDVSSLRFIVHVQQQSTPPPPAALTDKIELRQAVVSHLQRAARESQQSLRTFLSHQHSQGNVTSFRSFWIFNGLVVTADLETLVDLAGRNDVQQIRADRQWFLEPAPEADTAPPTTSAVEWNISRVRADLAWTAFGLDGKGVTVAVMDTGVDVQHPALLTRYRGYDTKGFLNHRGNWYSATDEGYQYPGDGNGHGTHVAGTVVGTGGIGIAPGGQWIAVKAFHNQGYTFDSWLHDGFQWLMAPAGDPALAPDIVNASWGTDIASDETFRQDIATLRRAGILPVFSAGNNGPASGSVGSPASFPETLAVGALDGNDEVVSFSGRGPSPWEEVKPELVAPGVQVRSARPGGGYWTLSGTSMAAPHVSGVAALLLQEKPALSADQLELVLVSTAVPLGGPIPNQDTGWGRVDAYRAATAVAAAGYLAGQVTRSVDGGPVTWGTLHVRGRDEGSRFVIPTDAAGRYSLALRPGSYTVRSDAFGYRATEVVGVRVTRGLTTTVDFSLDLLPTGALFGRVTDVETGAPLTATVSILDTPLSVETDPTRGTYSIALPPGTYRLRVAGPGYRVEKVSGITIEQGRGTSLDFALRPAPAILLVDSGAWYYDSQIRYFQEALDDLGYLYHTWTIVDPERNLPRTEDMIPYDIAIWSAPQDSPGFIGATGVITGYLQEGGRLLITGQEIGYWDGGGTQIYFHRYYRDYLHARYIRDNAGTQDLVGLAGDIFDGLTLSLRGGDGADNQRFPDEIAVARPEHASPTIAYEDAGIGGLRADVCLPYRVVYLSFGFEGISSRADRAEVMRRSIEALMAPPPQVGLTLKAIGPGIEPQRTRVGQPGQVVTHTVSLRNTGQDEDTYEITLSGSTWPTAAMDGTFASPLTATVSITVCQQMAIGLAVSIPAETTWNESDTVTVSVRSTTVPTVTAALALTSKTPAPILLVDDDRWYHVEGRYEESLSANGYPFDLWNVGWNTGDALGRPASAVLPWYPFIVWFTGYDWNDTLTPAEEEALMAYLDAGGRLFLSGQDYLYNAGLSDFGVNYLGVLTYTEGLSTTVATGVPGNPVGDGLGPYQLKYPYLNWSDGLEPVKTASAAFVGEEGQTSALTHAPPGSGFASAFFAFPFEALPKEAAPVVMERIITFLHPLGASTLTADKEVAAEGDRLTYTIVLRDASQQAGREVLLTNVLPERLEMVPGSLTGGANYDRGQRRVSWQGTVEPGLPITITYQAALPAVVPDGLTVTNAAEIADGTGIVLRPRAVTRVDVPDLRASTKAVDRAVAAPNDRVTYTITLSNTGTAEGRIVSLADTVPTQTVVITDTLWTSSGAAEIHDGTVFWAGSVPVGQPVAVTYAVTVTVPHGGFTLANHARIDDGYGQVIERRATTLIPSLVYFPLIMRGSGR